MKQIEKDGPYLGDNKTKRGERRLKDRKPVP